MGNCTDIEPQLTAYVDGEVDGAQRTSLEAHLQRCPPCRQRVASERATHDLLESKRAELRGCAPDGLRHRCAAQRAVATARSGLLAAPMLVPLSLAATVILGIALFVVFGWGSSVETYAAQLADDHMACFKFPPSETALDLEAIRGSWAASNGWPLTIAPSSESEGLKLLGVRRCGSKRGPVAHVLYRWWGAPLSVYVLNASVDRVADAGVNPDAHETLEAADEEAVIWREKGRTYAVIARGRVEDVEHVAEYIRTAME